MTRRPPAPLRRACLRQGAQECGLPARKRPGWPPSQEGCRPPPLPGRLEQVPVLPDESGLARLQFIVKRSS